MIQNAWTPHFDHVVPALTMPERLKKWSSHDTESCKARNGVSAIEPCHVEFSLMKQYDYFFRLAVNQLRNGPKVSDGAEYLGCIKSFYHRRMGCIKITKMVENGRQHYKRGKEHKEFWVFFFLISPVAGINYLFYTIFFDSKSTLRSLYVKIWVSWRITVKLGNFGHFEGFFLEKDVLPK